MYHGVGQTVSGAIDRLNLALLDRDNSLKVLRCGDEWVFGPQESCEKEGDVRSVVFSCGWVLDEETGKIKMYYGAASVVVECSLVSPLPVRLIEIAAGILSTRRF